MAIRGSLREASLPDVLQLLALGNKTGCMSVTHRNNFGYVYFDRGRICYASILNRRDRLGDILVRNGALLQPQLEAAISLQERQRNKKLGQILMEQGLIARAALEQHIRFQIEEAVYFLFTWSEGTFSFEADVKPDEEDILVSINPESLLLEGARRVDEWSLIEKKIPSFDLIFDLDRAKLQASAAELADEQKILVGLIDGKRDVAALIEQCDIGEFTAGKALYGLISAGFAHRVGKTENVRAASADARVEEHRNLGIAFYKTGMYEEAIREFRRVDDLRKGDSAARFYTGLVMMRQARWNEALELWQGMASQPGARHAVYHNLSHVLEMLGRLGEAPAATDEALIRGGAEDPHVNTSLGALLLQVGDANKADAVLTAGRKMWGARPPSAAWFHFSGLAAALVGELDRCVATLTEGIALHPHSAPLFNNLAVAYERRGSLEDAEAYAEKGSYEDSELPQIHKNLGDYHYRERRYEQALECYARAVKLSENLGDDVYFKLGNIRYRRQEHDEAVNCWEKALQLNPSNSIVKTNLEVLRRGK
jgi:tetratricopeptide (TPR) repeat protein